MSLINETFLSSHYINLYNNNTMEPLYKLTDKFGTCHVLTMSHRLDRQEYITKQLRQIGWGNYIHEDELDCVQFHYGTTWPYNELIMHTVNKLKVGRFTKPNEYDCTRNHYSIVKQAYDRGFKYVFIIEDDIRFLKNFDLFNKFIEHIPDDFDILQCGGFTVDEKIIPELRRIEDYTNNTLNDVNDYWYKNENIGVWNCSMYILSRKGMEYYINFINKFLWVADGPLFKAPLNKKIVKTYIPRIPLVIQEDKNKIESDIRNKNNDQIDYLADNMFEKNINFNNYL